MLDGAVQITGLFKFEWVVDSDNYEKATNEK